MTWAPYQDVAPVALLITGGRDRTDPTVEALVQALDPANDVLIVGDCPTGIDEQARRVACSTGVGILRGRADWKGLGKPAGMRRNVAMVRCLAALRDMGWQTAAVGFPGVGPGTRNCLTELVRAGFTPETL